MARKILSLGQYVKRRNGVVLGGSGALMNMFKRSLGANRFDRFWQYWNPIFGYYLSRYIFEPLKGILPNWIALLITFVACGLLHDLVTIAINHRFALLFTPWFLFMGIFVVLSKGFQLEYLVFSKGKGAFMINSLFNMSIILACLLLALPIWRAMT